MRKFIAYLSLVITTVLGIALSVKPLLSSVNSELDFNGGKTYTFQLTDEGENVADQQNAFEDTQKIYEVADQMEKRLINYGVQQYDIKVDGSDTLRVSVYESNDDKYTHLASYLRFDGKLALATSDNTYVYSNYGLEGETAKNMFGRNSYLTFNGYYPAVVLEINDVEEFQKAVTHATELDTSTEDENGEKQASDAAQIYLWNNWTDECVYDNANKYPVIQEKLLVKYDSNNIWYEKEEKDHKHIVLYFNVASDENATSLNISEVQAANENAKYFNALINAERLDGVTINLINQENVAAFVQSATYQGTAITPQMNFTIIGFSVAFGLMLLASIYYSRLLGATFAINTIAGFMMTSAIAVALGATFSVATVAALGIYCVSSIAFALFYSKKIRDNLAIQNNKQKACIDANKASTLFAVDISVVLMIAGLFIYIFAGQYLSVMGVIFVIGGLINLLINLVLNRLCFVCLAQSKVGANLALFGIFNKEEGAIEQNEIVEEEHNVLDDIKKEEEANAPKQEAPVRKGPSKLITGILYGLILLGGIITMSVTAAVSTPFKEESLLKTDDTRLVLYVEKDNTSYGKDTFVKETLDTVKVDVNGVKKPIYDNSNLDSVQTFESTFYTHESDLNDSISKTFIYYIVHLDQKIDVDTSTVFINDVQASNNLSQELEQLFTAEDQSAHISIQKSKSYGLTQSYYIPNVALASSIAIIACTIYLTLRYRNTLATALGILSISASAITLTLFSMFRIAVSPYMTIATLSVAMFALLLSIFVLEGNRLKVKLAKNETLNFDQKVDQYEIGMQETHGFAILFTVFAFMFSLMFMLSGTLATRSFFLFQGIMIIVAMLIIISFTLPIYKWLLKLTSNIASKTGKGPKSNKKKVKNQHKERQRGKEVEEATFIGIND